ncbi:MAG: peptidase M15 family protein, partial [Cyanobacteria bacterium Co-bin13]|nr:peptidase M15 family protein [Cyanobacteria bacterium Co-bin13]
MKVIVKSDTWFKLTPKPSDELTDLEKVIVRRGTELEIEFYVEVGTHHL